MFTTSDRTTLEILAHRLSTLLGAPIERIDFGERPLTGAIAFPNHVFAVEAKLGSSVAYVVSGIDRLEPRREGAIPLLVLPEMSRVGAFLCERAHVNWLDAKGAARIIVPNLPVILRV